MQNKRSFFLFIHVKHTSVSLFLGAYLDVPLVKITALQIESAFKATLVEKKPHQTTVSNFRGELSRILKHAQKHYNQKLSFLL